MNARERYAKLLAGTAASSVDGTGAEALEQLSINLYHFWTHREIHDESELKAFSGLLYHYTTPAGFLGIVSTQKIWGTDANFLNDSSEIQYGRAVALAALDLATTETREDWAVRVANGAGTVLSSRTESVFLACFCESGDLLSQWRSYSVHGEGYAIGLDTSKLSKYQRKGPWWPIKVRPVVYERSRQLELCATEITTFLDLVRVSLDLLSTLCDSGQTPDTKERDIFLTDAGRVLGYVLAYEAIRFKDAAFAEEREWRAIYLPRHSDQGELMETLGFRVAGSRLVPYVEFDLGASAQKARWALPIEEVVVGPKVSVQHTEISLRLLYKKLGWPSPEVRPSSIPLC